MSLKEQIQDLLNRQRQAKIAADTSAQQREAEYAARIAEAWQQYDVRKDALIQALEGYSRASRLPQLLDEAVAELKPKKVKLKKKREFRPGVGTWTYDSAYRKTHYPEDLINTTDSYELTWGRERLVRSGFGPLHAPTITERFNPFSDDTYGGNYWNVVRVRLDSDGLIQFDNQNIIADAWQQDLLVIEVALAEAIVNPARADDIPRSHSSIPIRN